MARGQATVEYAALVAVVALMLLALAAWLPRNADPPARPPIDVGALATPAPPVSRIEPVWRSFRFRWPDDTSPAGLRRWFDRASTPVRSALLGVVFTWSAGQEIAGEARRFADDPAGWVRERGGRPGLQELREVVAGVRALPAWVREVRAMGYRDGSVRVARDLGRLAGRGTVEWFTRGRQVRRVLRRLPRRREAPERDAPGTRP